MGDHGPECLVELVTFVLPGMEKVHEHVIGPYEAVAFVGNEDAGVGAAEENGDGKCEYGVLPGRRGYGK